MSTDETAAKASGDLLLVALDALVRADAALPGFKGAVGVGVRSRKGELWWHARFDAKAECTITSTRPPKVDASLLLGEREAVAFMETGKIPRDFELAELRGNADLLKRVVTRYAKKQSLLEFRTDTP